MIRPLTICEQTSMGGADENARERVVQVGESTRSWVNSSAPIPPRSLKVPAKKKRKYIATVVDENKEGTWKRKETSLDVVPNIQGPPAILQTRASSEPRWLLSSPSRTKTRTQESVDSFLGVRKRLFTELNLNTAEPILSMSVHDPTLDFPEIREEDFTAKIVPDTSILQPLNTPSGVTSGPALTPKLPRDSSTVNIGSTCDMFSAVISDRNKYKRLMSHRGEDAQKLINTLQMVLDNYPRFDSLRRDLLVALLRLSKKSSLYPQCFTLKHVILEKEAVTAGHFGDIWKGQFQARPVCLKVVKVYQQSHVKSLLQAYSKEAMLWRNLSHINVLPFFGIHPLDDASERICLISPWMENANDIEFLLKNPLVSRILLISDVTAGIKYLHDNDIVHADHDTGRACLADFGLSSVLDVETILWNSNRSSILSGGTVRWQAPELIDPAAEDTRAGKASDVYAFCLCLLRGKVPFFDVLRDVTVIFKIMSGERPVFPEGEADLYRRRGLTDLMWNLMKRCWLTDPSARPTADELVMLLPLEQTDTRPCGEWQQHSSYFINSTYDTSEVLSAYDVDSLTRVISH